MARFYVFLFLFLVCAGTSASQADTVVRVGLQTGASRVSVGSSQDLVVSTTEHQPLGRVHGELEAVPSPQGISIGNKVFPGPSVLVTPTSGIFQVDRHPYRGSLEIHLSAASTLDAINWVSLEDYVGGVVGGEIPATWPAEALKAQAIACRSYALAKMTQTRTALYDVVASDKDQVYEGVTGARPSIEQAVNATRGQVLTYGGTIIKAYFHASCGGHTEDGQVVFGEQAEYLKGVDDPYCADSPYQHWDREYTVQELRRALFGGGIENLGQVLSIEASGTDPSGRVGQLAVVAEKGEQVVNGVDLRRILGYRDLRSTRFHVRVVKTITVVYENVITGPDSKEVRVTLIPQTIEIGFDETQPRYAGYHIDHPMIVMDAYGKLARRKPSDASAMVMVAGKGQLRKIQHGVYTVGMDRTVAITRFVVNETKQETVVIPGGSKKVTVEKQLPVEFSFDGQGWGHGVGMCQWGCRGMAQQGYNYQQILQHYYPGTTLSILK